MTILYRRSASIHPTNAMAPPRRPKSADVSSSQSRSSFSVRNHTGPVLVQALRPRPRSAHNFTGADPNGGGRNQQKGCHIVDDNRSGPRKHHGPVVVSDRGRHQQILRNAMNLGLPVPAPAPAPPVSFDHHCDIIQNEEEEPYSSTHHPKYDTSQPNVDSFVPKSTKPADMGLQRGNDNGGAVVAPVLVMENMDFVNEARTTAEDFFRAPTPAGLRDEQIAFGAQPPHKEPTFIPACPRFEDVHLHAFYDTNESEVRTSDPVWCPQPKDSKAAMVENLDAENFENERRYEGATWGMYYRIMKARANIPLSPAKVQTTCKVIMSPEEIHVMEKSKDRFRHRNADHSFHLYRDQTSTPADDDGVFAFDMDE
mmetsp:Transcript_14883/g.21968  ORF Transcript_14883/g.21968 Transcript_14883/m.21968 type:complete len:369 (-) Transcript_14883:357-1463(-)